MTEEKDGTGTVKSIRHWSSGKGLFIDFDEHDQDFYKFGSPHCGEGDYVGFTHKPGSGNFSDKREITEIKQLPDDARPKQGREQKPKQQNINHGIQKAVALKSAAMVVGNSNVNHDNIPKLVEQVAERFLEWLEGDDENGS